LLQNILNLLHVGITKLCRTQIKFDYLKEVNKKYNIEHFMQQNDIIRVQSSTKMTSQEFRVQHNMNKAQPEILLVYS